MRFGTHVSLVLAAVLILPSCWFVDRFSVAPEELDPEDYRRVTIEDWYSIKVPHYMEETFELSDEASAQFMNPGKEVYLMVFWEPKDDFIETFRELGSYNDSLSVVENYRLIQLESMEESLEFSAAPEVEAVTIHDFPAEHVLLKGEVEGVFFELAYLFTFIATDEDLMMFAHWTLAESMYKYQPTFEYTARSFQLEEISWDSVPEPEPVEWQEAQETDS